MCFMSSLIVCDPAVNVFCHFDTVYIIYLSCILPQTMKLLIYEPGSGWDHDGLLSKCLFVMVFWALFELAQIVRGPPTAYSVWLQGSVLMP